jgi:hypothetical protein
LVTEGKNPRLIGLRVAGLEMWLDATNTDLIISPTTSRVKFLQPVAQPQAGSYLTRTGDALILRLRNEPLPNTSLSEKLHYLSKTWEFWKDTAGHLIFLALEQVPPCKITVSPDFKYGEVLGNFSQVAVKTIYPLENLEIRLFAAWLATRGDMILHASGVMVDGRGYCFVGSSGAGKSTLVTTLAVNPLVTVLGEDQVILRYLGDRFWIFGTPWHIDPNGCSPEGVPLEKLFFLDRNAKPGVEWVTPLEGVARLLQTAFIPYYLQESMPAILDRLALLAETISFHSLSYQLGTDPWSLIFNT